MRFFFGELKHFIKDQGENLIFSAFILFDLNYLKILKLVIYDDKNYLQNKFHVMSPWRRK